MKSLKDMSDQLKEYETQLFNKEHQKDTEFAELRKEMGAKRQRQADDLKEDLRRA